MFSTRRNVLRATGLSLVGVTPASARRRRDGDDTRERYVVDVRSASSGAVSHLEVIHRLDRIGFAVVRASPSEISGLRASRDVSLSVARPFDRRADGTLPDGLTMHDVQWPLHDQQIGAAQRVTRGAGARVTVIDTGVYRGHPDLRARLNWKLSRNFTEDNGGPGPTSLDHGTLTAGVIASEGRDGGVVGVAPEAELVSCRIEVDKKINVGDLIAAITYSADISSDVANLSWGIYPLSLNERGGKEVANAFRSAAAYATARGTLLVAAAGNDSANLNADPKVIDVPAQTSNVMSVSATGPIGYRWDDGPHVTDPYDHLRDPTTTPAYYTNYGKEAVDLSAPGGNIDRAAMKGDSRWFLDLVPSTSFTGVNEIKIPGYSWAAGTSFAAPYVSGAAALVAANYPESSVEERRAHLLETARSIGPLAYRGRGHLDTLRAVTERPKSIG